MISYREILAKLAGEMGMPVENDSMQLPAALGKGFFRFVKLPNKMEALLMKLDLADDFWFNRGRTDLEHYVFVCEEIQNTGKIVIDIDGQQVVNEDPLVAGMHLVSFLSDLHQFVPKGSRVRGFRVVISPEWLASYLRIDKMEDVLLRYLQLKSASIHRKEMDQESRQMLGEILDHEGEITVDELAFIQNRVMMVLEGFFSWMYEEMTRNPRLAKIGREDIAKIREVEAFLLEDLSRAPVVNELARHATMSATRLKILFRQVFGLPPYEYFQQHRMLKAKQLLRDTKMPVQEIGRALGYSNMSNFTLAFRKVFGVNPSELRK